jgi:uncharacterized protein (TIGR03032 family)
MTEQTTASPKPEPSAPGPPLTAVNYEYSPHLVGILEQLRATLVISTYQAGKLVVVGVHEGALAFSFHGFERVMGVAVGLGQLAVGTTRQVWFLRAAHDLGPRVKPAGRHDACFLTRTSHVTGEIHGHEMAFAGDELWVVNTLFSCLCTLRGDYSFVPRWRPPFVAALAAEDRCHLNGLALDGGQPRYVTVLAETDTPAGWRPNKATTGCLLDVPSGATVARGFAMAHSPRVYDGRVWVLDSGRGRLTRVEPGSGRIEPVAELLGYARGLAFLGPFAFVGLSKIRETSVFGGIPIAERRAELKCGVAVVDLRTGRKVAGLDFHSGVDEIFDVQVLPGIRFPAVAGPNPGADGTETIWLVPNP